MLELLLVEIEIVGEGVVGDIPDKARRSSEDILEGVRKSEQMLLMVAFVEVSQDRWLWARELMESCRAVERAERNVFIRRAIRAGTGKSDRSPAERDSLGQ